jgi:hypothetical protein
MFSDYFTVFTYAISAQNQHVLLLPFLNIIYNVACWRGRPWHFLKRLSCRATTRLKIAEFGWVRDIVPSNWSLVKVDSADLCLIRWKRSAQSRVYFPEKDYNIVGLAPFPSFHHHLVHLLIKVTASGCVYEFYAMAELFPGSREQPVGTSLLSKLPPWKNSYL